ncbi:hypothetical protein M899_2830 [Bacteriovorax sp. BSW11_IV]|nr:hypothetical protein M899_2830 [Bacteriovorax sp. BSW11_IV]
MKEGLVFTRPFFLGGWGKFFELLMKEAIDSVVKIHNRQYSFWGGSILVLQSLPIFRNSIGG